MALKTGIQLWCSFTPAAILMCVCVCLCMRVCAFVVVHYHSIAFCDLGLIRESNGHNTLRIGRIAICRSKVVGRRVRRGMDRSVIRVGVGLYEWCFLREQVVVVVYAFVHIFSIDMRCGFFVPLCFLCFLCFLLWGAQTESQTARVWGGLIALYCS
ncbi:hypothetical protein EDD21DRAFT_392887 [Dissophora ornata]|nr:hypothetical protein EDD21DRAFT_392887 [Dissophora ornata]